MLTKKIVRVKSAFFTPSLTPWRLISKKNGWSLGKLKNLMIDKKLQKKFVAMKKISRQLRLSGKEPTTVYIN
jgi:hypothetical protein